MLSRGADFYQNVHTVSHVKVPKIHKVPIFPQLLLLGNTFLTIVLLVKFYNTVKKIKEIGKCIEDQNYNYKKVGFCLHVVGNGKCVFCLALLLKSMKPSEHAWKLSQ